MPLNLPLRPEHFLCTHFLQLLHKIEFTPTPAEQTAQGNSSDLILVFGVSYLEQITFIFPKLTLSCASSSNPSFLFLSLFSSSPRVSTTMTKQPAYKSPRGGPTRNSSDRAPMTIIKKRRLKTYPW